MKAFVSIVSTDSYALGALVMYESLLATNPAYPFYLVVTQFVTEECEKRLRKYGVNIIRDDENILVNTINKNEKRWNYTFDKIKIFRLIQFEKIVFIDCDMLILNNIDNLFEKPHFSAVQTRVGMPWLENKKYFNSGLMVIEPSIKEFSEIISFIQPTISEFNSMNVPVGDQNVLHNFYKEWPLNNTLTIDDGYNVFWSSVYSFYRQNEKSPTNTLHIVHFTGRLKPWFGVNKFLVYYLLRSVLKFEISFKSIRLILTYKKILQDCLFKLK